MNAVTLGHHPATKRLKGKGNEVDTSSKILIEAYVSLRIYRT